MIFDVSAGLRYRELKNQGVFGQNYVTMTLNTDGIPVFHSSGYAFWPVYLVINELPFRMRFSKDNRILAGLWYGSMKPDMGLFLKPIAESIANLTQEGFSLNTEDARSSCTFKAFLTFLTCDLPAKAIVLNTVQFNGYWGCSKCLQKGCRVACGEGRGSVQTYPFDDADPCGPARTHASSCEFAKNALMIGSSCNGIKGPSCLATVPHFDVIHSTSVDYMHCVLLGICRQLLKLWVEPIHRQELWYIGNKLKEMDKCLLGIKPPSEVKRTPRSIQTTRKYWKAHELRSWLLHYSPVVLKHVLHDEYYKHHLLLVEGVYLLLGDIVSAENVANTTRCFKKYCFLFSTFYGERHMSMNIHSLLHLPGVVEDLGPLWASSCFGFESANGELLDVSWLSKC